MRGKWGISTALHALLVVFFVLPVLADVGCDFLRESYTKEYKATAFSIKPAPITKPTEVWTIMKGGECYAYKVGDLKFTHTCHSTYKEAYAEMRAYQNHLESKRMLEGVVWEDVEEDLP